MILPIVAYGDPVLKQIAKDITPQYPDLKKLIENMFSTMHNANGIGLAAPQIGLPIRLFIVDASPLEEEGLHDFKRVFINAEIIDESDEEWAYNEGCLSIPDVRADVYRPDKIVMRYLDENFKQHESTFDGLPARIIQHEYDHIEGILFTDYLSPLKRSLLQKSFSNISKGAIKVNYKMRFPKQSKKR
jgi:peptide deformylase